MTSTAEDVLSDQRLVGKDLFDWPVPEGGRSQLHGSRCRHCGEVVFPLLLDCPVCVLPMTMEEFRIEGRGVLNDFVVTQRGPAGFVVPYVQGYVKLDDGPVIYSMLTGVEPTEDGPTLQARMEMVIDVIRSDESGSIIGWKFEPEAQDA